MNGQLLSEGKQNVRQVHTPGTTRDKRVWSMKGAWIYLIAQFWEETGFLKQGLGFAASFISKAPT